MMWGLEVAETLAAEGLLASDAPSDLAHLRVVDTDQEPTHWRVTLKPSKVSNLKYPSYNLRKEFRAAIGTWRSWRNSSTPNKPMEPVSVVFGKRSTARAQATHARNEGFEGTIEDCILVPINVGPI